MARSTDEVIHMRINRKKLNRVRRILGTSTTEETVEAALDAVLFQQRAVDGIRRLAGANILRDINAEGEVG